MARWGSIVVKLNRHSQAARLLRQVRHILDAYGKFPANCYYLSVTLLVFATCRLSRMRPLNCAAHQSWGKS